MANLAADGRDGTLQGAHAGLPGVAFNQILHGSLGEFQLAGLDAVLFQLLLYVYLLVAMFSFSSNV